MLLIETGYYHEFRRAVQNVAEGAGMYLTRFIFLFEGREAIGVRSLLRASTGRRVVHSIGGEKISGRSKIIMSRVHDVALVIMT